MCFTHDVIERQALKICEEMKMYSIYSLVGVATTGDQVKIQENTSIESNFKLLPGEALPLITNVMLQDAYGRVYSVSPDEAGLQFAKGEVTYKEYKRLQAKEKIQLTTILIASGGTLFLLSWSFLRFFI
ncbi:hypothetical protein ACFRCQ_19610 [Cytobacillus firmus]|uniref:RING-type E3 ubiquitin transferase n=1 Tax=Cytobacillus oceanisediminis TaxID=665099 RepID=A0ABX3CN98_9BACI|nr:MULTISPECIES: hypothetical protein [Cytobacillus]OHX44726.1 hypothetical protein BBV17_24785 [Cytobacillus oceanisediminis]